MRKWLFCGFAGLVLIGLLIYILNLRAHEEMRKGRVAARAQLLKLKLELQDLDLDAARITKRELVGRYDAMPKDFAGFESGFFVVTNMMPAIEYLALRSHQVVGLGNPIVFANATDLEKLSDFANLKLNHSFQPVRLQAELMAECISRVEFAINKVSAR